MEIKFSETTLGEIADFKNGKALQTTMYSPAGLYPVYGSNGQVARSNEFLYSENLIVIGRVGAYCGSVYHVAEKSWVTDNAIIVTAKPGNDLHFLYYLINSLQLNRTAIGSAQPLLTQSGLKLIKTAIPPLPEQRRIAHILGTLDDKIELNRRMNATLESMARALFKSWFVDFDPVRAKQQGHQPANMDPATAALFPSDFEDSQLGPIPKGWKVGTINRIVDFSRVALNPSNFPNVIFDHYSLPAFDNNRSPRCEFGNEIKSNKFTVSPDAVLLSKLNPHIPRIWMPNLGKAHPAICSTEFLVSCPRSGVSREFIYSLFVSESFARMYGTLVMGSTGSHQRIRAESVLAANVVIAPDIMIQNFSRFTKPMFDSINQNTEKYRTLTALRDALLPKLLSSELCVQKADFEHSP